MQVELSEIPLVADTACGAGALKGEAIVNYCEPLITQLEDPAYCGEMNASGSPFG